MKITTLMILNNESSRINNIEDTISIADVDRIVLIDNNSTDDTFKEINKLAKKYTNVFTLATNLTDFSAIKNTLMQSYNDSDYFLFIDADEVFDKYFLRNIKRIIQTSKNAHTYAFSRINLPQSKNYPDYQVRLLKNDTNQNRVEFRGEVHEKVYAITLNKSVLDCNYDGSTEMIDSHTNLYWNVKLPFKIIHMQRRTDIKRSWW